MAEPAADAARIGVRVTGTVQGVGFRPFVYGLAAELHLTGHVGNDAAGVFAQAQGSRAALAEFVRRLREDAPPLARVLGVASDSLPVVADEEGFGIAESGEGAGSTSIPPDTAVCEECLAELRDPADRRFGYPFIACTHCGPRYTMTVGLPYDRARTTMADFPLCAACMAEYTDPGSRRFHAQPTACADCGPQVSMPVPDIVAALRAGQIVAIKGIGGYHLACDAADAEAVAALRARKGRGRKPFAVMARDLATAGRLVRLDAAAEELLTSRARPIVIAQALLPEPPAALAELAQKPPAALAELAPGNHTLGVMLAYTPLHHLLFDAGAPEVLVMTSGNLSDEPICTDPAEAHERLAHIADVFVDHDRRIHVACDDSVVRVVGDAPAPVRRSRGYAPSPLPLPLATSPVLAVGGARKTTVCAAAGTQAWLSQHIGDTANFETLAMLTRTADTLCALQQVAPEAIISDRHPGYLSRRWAAERAAAIGVPHLSVQHHHAHLAALLAEHGRPPGEPVIGVVLDGTGYGTDGTIWGGELLVGDYASVRRAGHLRPVSLPGGDAAIKHPARTAAAHLHAAGLPLAGTASEAALARGEAQLLAAMLSSGSHCTPTTSMGRLFDAVSSLLGVSQRSDYEGQAAIELEARAAAAWSEAGATATPGHAGNGRPSTATWPAVVIDTAEGVLIDPSGWLGRAVRDHAAGVPAERSALAFHLALADAIAEAVMLLAEREGVRTVGLTGGVFANEVLSRACQRNLGAAGLAVLVHRTVPANDGGLALGQVAVAAAGGAV